MNTHDYLTRLVAGGLSQSQIAAATGVSQPAISRILNGIQQDVSYSDGKKLEALHRKTFGKKKAA